MNFVVRMRRAGLQVTTESTLFYPSVPQVTAAEVAAHLDSMLDREKTTVVKEEVSASARYISLQASGCNIRIEAGTTTRPPAAYFEALDWPMLHLSFPEAETVVRGHRAHVHVTAEAEYDAVANTLGVRALNTSYARNLVAGRVMAALCRVAQPTGIHWRGCEMTYMPGHFVRELETNPLSLFVRVTPFSSNRYLHDMRMVGASTRGAFELLGREVVLEEAPVPAQWTMRTLHEFVSRSHASGGYPPHLATFSTSRGDAMIVRHLVGTPDIEEEHISLELRASPGLGYDASRVHAADIGPPPPRPRWDGIERRSRPRSAKSFGRRGLN